MPDPFNALGNFILGKLRDRTLEKFAAFLLALLISGLGGFLIGASSTIAALLLKGSPPAVALVGGLGAGLGLAAICLGGALRADKTGIAKMLIVVWPQAEALEEINANLQRIEKR